MDVLNRSTPSSVIDATRGRRMIGFGFTCDWKKKIEQIQYQCYLVGVVEYFHHSAGAYLEDCSK